MKTTLISCFVSLGIGIPGASAFSGYGDMGGRSSNGNNNMSHPNNQSSMPDKQIFQS